MFGTIENRLARVLLNACAACLPLWAVAACSTPSGSSESQAAQAREALTSCTNLPEWTVKTYQGGNQVRHVGHAYQCKPYPYSGWCGQVGYEPGVSLYWSQAWTDLGTCSTSAGAGGAGGTGGTGGSGGSKAGAGGAGTGGTTSADAGVGTRTADGPGPACDTVECCPSGSTPVVLSAQSDQLVSTQPNRCIVALAGSDVIQCAAPGCTVLGGPEADVIMAGEGSTVRGGDGDDVINGFTNGVVLGNAGNDTISAANGNNFVYPGAGADNVSCGTGDDTVVIYDLCEVAAGEKLDGGDGTNTLVTPVPVSVLQSRGVTVSHFGNIVLQANACKSDCTVKPDCSGNGECAEGDASGTMKCACKPGFIGSKCDVFCPNAGDSDGDGTPDCVDECPFNAAKTARGVCGCMVADTDTDHDGTPDCHDRCPRDPAHVAAGVCGCVGEEMQRPAGTPCSTPVCPGQANATCNDAGVCGDATSCQPEPDCRLVESPSSTYWVCPSRSWAAASASCAAKAFRLVRVDTYDENRRLAAMVATPFWLGANARATSGVWRWSTGTNDSGDAFWTGGAAGSVVDGRFAFWSAAKPALGSCASLDPSDGRWSDRACSDSLPYVCEYTAPEGLGPAPKLPLPAQPSFESTTCIPGDAGALGAPDDPDAMAQQAAMAEQDVFVGAAANPPAPGASVCPHDPAAENCPLTGVVMTDDGLCTKTEDCAHFGPSYVCALRHQFPRECVHADNEHCHVEGRCGIPDCPDAGPNDCQQIEVCENAGSTYAPAIDPESNLTGPTEVPPTSLYRDAQPSFVPSDAYVDPADASTPPGINHPWCQLKPQATGKVQPALAAPSKSGKSGSGSPIEFSFNPNVTFDANPKPLAFGETDFSLHAEASLDAAIAIKSFLGMSPAPFHILDGAIGVTAKRCRIKTSDSKFILLGLDFTDNLPAAFRFDTNDFLLDDGTRPGAECDRTLAKFQETADRVKKAFRDAQQLVSQLKSDKLAFGTSLCEKLGIAASVLPGFPGGNLCADGEPAELTIDRMLWYYQGDDNSQLDQLTGVTGALADASGKLLAAIQKGRGALSTEAGFEVPLNLPDKSETWNVFATTFAIGPVPVTIEVDAAASYGLGGQLDFGLSFPTGLSKSEGDLSNPDSPKLAHIAHARVSVEPHAAAGLVVYAAVGTRFISAGVEGALSLARVNAPFRAGVGLGMATIKESRPVPDDIGKFALVGRSIEDALPFGKGVAYRFYLTDDYGAAIRLEDILRGKINAKVKVRFGFFSRTWRKKVYEFSGLPVQEFKLLEGGGRSEIFQIGSSRVDSGNDLTPMGLSEAQVPLARLEPLPPPSDDTVQPLVGAEPKLGELKQPFYDQLCCSKEHQACGSTDTPGCCPDLQCVKTWDQTSSCLRCPPAGAGCDSNTPCCDGNVCIAGTCKPCVQTGDTCNAATLCCNGTPCGYGRCDPND